MGAARDSIAARCDLEGRDQIDEERGRGRREVVGLVDVAGGGKDLEEHVVVHPHDVEEADRVLHRARPSW